MSRTVSPEVATGSMLDPAAIERLLQRWEPWARRLAHRFDDSTEREDLEQVARLAIWQAAQRFDPTRGCQFSSFAVPTVMGCLRRYIRDRKLAGRFPRRWWELRPRLKAAASALAQGLGREPSVPELAAWLGMSEEDAAGAMGLQELMYPVSLDQLLEEPDGEQKEALAGRIGAIDPLFEAVELRVVVRQALERLSPDLRDILERRYFHGLSEQEVARQVGVPPMQISRLERRALALLRQGLREVFDSGRLERSAPIRESRSPVSAP